MTGAVDGTTPLSLAELFDPSTSTWSPAEGTAARRYGLTATLLPTGKVLVLGGFCSGRREGFDVTAATERYDSRIERWSAGASVLTPRTLATAPVLRSGKVLVAGVGAGRS